MNQVTEITRLIQCLLSERLESVKEVEVKTAAVGNHHNMRCAPDMRHNPIVVFHLIILLCKGSVILSGEKPFTVSFINK
jgi:hypothetical protein